MEKPNLRSIIVCKSNCDIGSYLSSRSKFSPQSENKNIIKLDIDDEEKDIL